MVLQVLHPDDVRELLRGYTPTNEERERTDRDRRAAITKRKCPRCEKDLMARLPADPSKVFDADGVCYEGHCTQHGLIT
jgi:hypothetical protein